MKENTELVLAPLRGLTDATYRDVFASYFPGFDRALAPFITSYQGNSIKKNRLDELLPQQNRKLKITPQILAKNPENFKNAALILADLGYQEVNWNLGCPYPMVANKKRGSGLLPHPDHIKSFLDVLADLPIRLSIKTRLGRYDSAEILALIPIFNQADLSELIIHPRTGVQMYKGEVDLNGFNSALALSEMPVAYNGDIRTRGDFSRLEEKWPEINTWMIGRGALIDPFLPARIKGLPLPSDPMEHLRDFHAQLFSRYQKRLAGDSHLLGRMKGVWFYLAGSFSNSGKILKKIQRSRSLAKYQGLVDRCFQAETLISQ